MTGIQTMRTPALEQLMGAYFHQDWELFGSTHMEVVDYFVEDDPDLAATLPAEIALVLERLPSDTAVHQYLDSLGCQILIRSEDGYREWLADIAARVQERLSPT